MEIVGDGSSLLIVPVPGPFVPRRTAPPVGLVRATLKVSVGSNFASPLTVTLNGCEVTPAGKFSVCVLATQSLSAVVARPSAVAGAVLGPDGRRRPAVLVQGDLPSPRV